MAVDDLDRIKFLTSMSFILEIKRQFILEHNVTIKHVKFILAIHAQWENRVFVELGDVDFHYS